MFGSANILLAIGTAGRLCLHFTVSMSELIEPGVVSRKESGTEGRARRRKILMFMCFFRL